MLILVILSLLFCGVQTCSDNCAGDEAVMKKPSMVHPQSEVVPDSTKLVNDSVIILVLTPNNGSYVGDSESIQLN